MLVETILQRAVEAPGEVCGRKMLKETTAKANKWWFLLIVIKVVPRKIK